MSKKITGLGGLAALTGLATNSSQEQTSDETTSSANNQGSVYSTELGKTCPKCGYAVKQCRCTKASDTKGDGKVRISLDKKGRKGKGMTLIKGLPLNEAELKTLAKKLKQKSGVGGAVKDGIIEIQGDQRQAMLSEMKALGYQAKQSGG